jgi:nicotinamidase-related amidase
MAASWLIIIDVQRGFLNDWTRHLPARVERLQGRYDRVVATRFVNPPGSPYRRWIHWRRFAPGSDDVELAFAPRPGTPVRDKAVYGAVTDPLLRELRADGVAEVHLCGIATDNCVLKTAVDLFENGIRPLVLADYCASHGGPECHDCGLRLLRRFIGADQVIAGPLLDLDQAEP